MTEKDAYRELFERSADAILIIEDGRFVDCNAAAVQMLRASDQAEVLRTHPSELSPPRQPDGRASFDKANEMIALAFERGSHRFEWNHTRVDGEVFPVEVLLTALNEKGRSTLHVVWRDITGRKKLENSLRHAQKMEAVGKLAGGIAHDFNNLLVVMMGNCDLLSLNPPAAERFSHIEQIRGSAEKAAELIQQLTTLSRSQEVAKRAFGLGALVAKLRPVVSRMLGEDIALGVKTSGPSEIFANASNIEQIVLNLTDNAREAMPDGGELTLEIRPAKRTGTGEPGTLLRVTDTGIGMTAQTRERAFEPFFTTKDVGSGSGLGLSSVYGIVQQSGGDVSLESQPGEGTTVSIWFPQVEQLSSAPPVEQRPGTVETILIVEDDSTIRQIARTLLEKNGFEVYVAADGEEGLAFLGAEEQEVSLIISDVVMPKMSGPEMVLELRERGVEAPVLFMSGYTDAALEQLRPLREHFELLQKPFSLPQFVGKVRMVIDRDQD